MKKALVTMMCAVLSLTMVFGCGKKDKDAKDSKSTKNVTVEDVVDMVFDAKMSSANMKAEVVLDAALGVQGMNIPVTLNVDVDLAADRETEDDFDANLKMSYKLSALGQEQSESNEAYFVKEGDEITVYNNEDDEWTYKNETIEDVPLDEDSIEEYKDMIKTIMLESTLEKKTKKIDGVECYNLSFDATAEIFIPALEAAAEKAGEFISDEDYDKIYDLLDCVPVNGNIYVSVEDGYIVKAEFDFSDLDIAEIISNFEDEMPMEGLEDAVAINEFTVVITLSDVNDTDVEVPNDIVENAVEAGSISGDWDYIEY